MTIYKITNTINGKVYIGQTVNNVQQRWKEHCKPSRASVSVISLAIQKYGKDSFVFEVIDTADSLEELNVKEQTYITSFSCVSPNGYNLNSGGNNYVDSEETRKKKGNARKLWTLTEESKKKMSAAKSGKPVTDRAKYEQKLGKHLKSLYADTGKGVRYSARDNAYQAFIGIDGINKYKSFTVSVLGEHALVEAIKQRQAYEEEATEYYKSKLGEINGTNN